MTDLNMFIPITKVDEEKRLVYGIATAEAPDKSGEICDYESTVPHYRAWSAEFAKVTDGKSLGNIRAMHGKVAVGKAVDLTFDDDNKRIMVCAKIVDDNEWKKCLDGVYTGFSQGGSYVKRWDDPDDPSLKRYTAKPTEISLVDVPCLPIATFEYVKSDGSSEIRKFAQSHFSEADEDLVVDAWEVMTRVLGKKDVSTSLADSLVAESLVKVFTETDHPRDEKGRFTTASVLSGLSRAGRIVVGAAAGAAAGASTRSGAGGRTRLGIHTISGAVAGGAAAAGSSSYTSAAMDGASAGWLTGVAASGIDRTVRNLGRKAQDRRAERTDRARRARDSVKIGSGGRPDITLDPSEYTEKFYDDVSLDDRIASDIVTAARGTSALLGKSADDWEDCVNPVCSVLLSLDPEVIEKNYSSDQPRGDNGRWTSSLAVSAAGMVGALAGSKFGGTVGNIAGQLVGTAAGALSGLPQGIPTGRAVGGAIGTKIGQVAGSVAVGALSEHVVSRAVRSKDDKDTEKKKKKTAKIASSIDEFRLALPLSKTLLSVVTSAPSDSTPHGNKDLIMSQDTPKITNEQIVEKANELASAAGDPTSWPSRIEAARDALEKAAADGNAVAYASQAVTTTPSESVVEKKADAEASQTEVIEKKADAEPQKDAEDMGVRQVWLAKDGSTHQKKADALAKNAQIAENKTTSPIEAALSKIDAVLKPTEGQTSEVTEKAAAIAELRKYLGEEVYDVTCAVNALSQIFTLLRGEIAEAESNPEQVSALQDSANRLKDFIVSEIQEDNSSVMAMAAKMGDLAKSLEKAGARHSAKDMESIQKIHDHCKDLGCDCGDASAEKSEQTGDLSKVAAENESLKKTIADLAPRLEEIGELVKKQSDEIVALKKQPVPPPVLRAVNKGGDVVFSAGDAVDEDLTKKLAALSAEEKATLFVKLSQQNPLNMIQKG